MEIILVGKEKEKMWVNTELWMLNQREILLSWWCWKKPNWGWIMKHLPSSSCQQTSFLVEKYIRPSWMGLPFFIFFHVSPFYVIVSICLHFVCIQVLCLHLSASFSWLSHWYYYGSSDFQSVALPTELSGLLKEGLCG